MQVTPLSPQAAAENKAQEILGEWEFNWHQLEQARREQGAVSFPKA